MLETLAPGHYRLQGQFTLQETAMLTQLLSLVKDASFPLNQLNLDVSALEVADSVLLAALIEIARRVEKQKITLCVTGLSDGMRGLARVYSIDTLIKRYQSHS